MFFPDALWCQGIFLWTCLAGVKVHSVQKVLRFDAPMARGLWWAAAPPVCIKPLQPGCRPGKTGKPPCGRGKPYNRAFGAREIHPYPRLRRYFPRRGKSALHFALISYVVKSITVISHLRGLPPYPASPDFLHGKACHWIFGSLCFPTNPVPLPPYSGGRINRSMLPHRDMWHNA
mgnify:CR=1 FL=1